MVSVGHRCHALCSPHQTNRAETQCRFVGDGAVKKLLEQRLPTLILRASTTAFPCLSSVITQNLLQNPQSEMKKAKVRQSGKSNTKSKGERKDSNLFRFSKINTFLPKPNFKAGCPKMAQFSPQRGHRNIRCSDISLSPALTARRF